MRLLALLIILTSIDANASQWSLDAGVEYRKIKPDLANIYSGLGTDTASLFDEVSTLEDFKKSLDILVSLQTSYSLFFGKLGLYYRHQIPEDVVQEATTGVTLEDFQKTTTLTGYLAGVFLRYNFNSQSDTKFFFDFGLGAGFMYLGQEVLVEETISHTMDAQAFNVEAFGRIGLKIAIWGPLHLDFAAGFSRSKTSSFKVTSTSGTIYSEFAVEDRIAVTDDGETKDLEFDKSGINGYIGLSIPFGLSGFGGGGI